MKKFTPPLAVIIAALLWSMDGFLRQELYSVSSFLIITLEHALGAIIFFPLLLRSWNEIRSMGQQEWVSLLWVSICGGIMGTFFNTKALSYIQYIDLSVVVLLQKLQPLFAIALAAIILKEKITQKFLLLAGAAMVGGYLVTFGTEPMENWSEKTLIAALLATLAAFSWGSSTVLGKHALKQLTFTTVTALRLLLTAIVALIIFVITQGSLVHISLDLHQWRIMILIVLSTGAVALFIYYYGLKNLPASHATVYELTWPLSAVIIDWVVRGRVLSLSQIIGATLILGSMTLLTQEKRND